MEAKRLICRGPRQIEVETHEIPPVPDDGILVKQDFTAVSVGTEIYNWIHGAEPGREAVYPRPTGYCGAGTVLQVGKCVADIVPGDRVAGQGGHGSHAVIRAPYQKIPDGVTTKAAAFTTMAAIALHGVRVAALLCGESVAVVGLGLVGQLSLSFARLSGAVPLIAVDLDEARLERAKARGAEILLNPRTTPDVPAAIRETCPEDGANVVLEATGIPAVFPMAVKSACTAGRVVALGSPRGTVEFDFFQDVHLREVSILGALQPRTPDADHIYYRWTKDRERKLILRLMADGRLPVEDLITHTAAPEQCLEIYQMLADHPGRALGVVFDWRGRI